MPERGLPDATVEVGRVEGRAASGREDELLGRVVPALQCSPRERPERSIDGGEERHRAETCIRLRAPQLPERVGALDPDQAAIAVDVAEAKRAELASAEAGAERDVEEMNVKPIRLVSERVGRREVEKRGPDRRRVLVRDLLAREVLRRR